MFRNNNKANTGHAEHSATSLRQPGAVNIEVTATDFNQRIAQVANLLGGVLAGWAS